MAHRSTQNNLPQTTESTIFVQPSAIMAYREKSILIQNEWVQVKETAEQICQLIYSAD
ncbi:hypothetical protein UFOVP116_279 [uncultured Caudovirales phage]|uniref:Uncharacterized protein n=1 Tax=uncultured Caudovirales phage TaxID=2100421 RepID=A0A6J5LEP5_9CAUD|nr:hypothetical protein UFOVP116_279 [uncultured Caudovirales phage]